MDYEEYSNIYKDYVSLFKNYTNNLNLFEQRLQQGGNLEDILLINNQLRQEFDAKLNEVVESLRYLCEKKYFELELKNQISKSLLTRDYPQIVCYIEYICKYPNDDTWDDLINIFIKLKNDLNYKAAGISFNVPAFIHEPIIDILFSMKKKSITALPIAQTMIDFMQQNDSADDLIGCTIKSLYLIPPNDTVVTAFFKKVLNHKRIEIRDEVGQILNGKPPRIF